MTSTCSPIPGGDRTAEVKVFTDVSPASDGQLHLSFSAVQGGSGMLSAIEILPGIRGRIRPVRIVARDVPYYSNDSHWWSPDAFFKGGQLSGSQEAATDTDDPGVLRDGALGPFFLCDSRCPGRYSVTLHLIEHHAGAGQSADGSGTPSADRVFNVFCNGKTIAGQFEHLSTGWERTVP